MKALISLAIAVCLISSGFAATELSNIEVNRQGDSLYIDITATQSCLYDHFMIKEAPEKIVVDLKGTANNWSQSKYSDLPFKSFIQIRTSQFQVTPELITRVVLDINRPIDYSAAELSNGVRIKIPVSEDELENVNWRVIDGFTAVRKIVDQETEQPEPLPGPSTESSPEIADVPTSSPEPPAEKTDFNTPPPKPSAEMVAPPKPVEGSVIDEFPKRKEVKYEPGSERDPFQSLVGVGTGHTPGQLPTVENLKFVGIFDDENGTKALFEDSEGNGFILMPNDRIQSGYLVSIQSDKAIFQVTEYGWTRTIALNLQMPELK